MKTLLKIFCFLLVTGSVSGQANKDNYLNNVRDELNKKWPGNRTINFVYHGHSVPSGYYTGGVVHTFDAYPRLATKLMKEIYPYAVINTITTSIGGEQAIQGQKRFVDDVFPMRPDVIFIDYGLNDRHSKLADVRVAWEMMIDSALAYGYKVILLTPTPDSREDILSDNAPLAAHAAQIRELAAEKDVGLVDSYKAFKNLKEGGTDLSPYMAQVNHINKLGHDVVAEAIYEWFAPVKATSEFYFDFEEKVIEGTDSFVSSSDINIRAKLNHADIVFDDERGYVLNIDSDADYAQLSATPIDSSDFSISYWYKSNDQRAWRRVMHGDEAHSRHFTCLNYEQWSAAKSLCVYRQTVAGYASSQAFMQDDQWHHIVFVANSGFGCLFVDGSQKAAVSFDVSGDNFTSFFFGSPSNKSAYFKMDDVYFYKTAIGLNQVTEIYNEQKDKDAAGIEDKSSAISPYKIISTAGEVTIESNGNHDLNGSEFSIFHINGKLEKSGILDRNLCTLCQLPQSGTYILKINHLAEKRIYTQTFITHE